MVKPSEEDHSLAAGLRGFASEAPQKAHEEVMTTLGSWQQRLTHLLAHENNQKSMAQLIASTRASTEPAVSHWKQVALPQFFAAAPVLPLGDGAYLDGKAVAQRT